MFEKITREKVRFQSPRGALTIEDIWDLPLRDGTLNLDDIAKKLFQELQYNQESFVTPKKKDTLTKLKFNAVRHIISVKLEEEEKRKIEAQNKIKYNKIVDIIAEKEVDELKEKSTKELERELKKYKNNGDL